MAQTGGHMILVQEKDVMERHAEIWMKSVLDQC